MEATPPSKLKLYLSESTHTSETTTLASNKKKTKPHLESRKPYYLFNIC